MATSDSRHLIWDGCANCGGPLFVNGLQGGPAVLVAYIKDGMPVEDVYTTWKVYHADCSPAPYSIPIDLGQTDTVAKVNDLIRHLLSNGGQD